MSTENRTYWMYWLNLTDHHGANERSQAWSMRVSRC